MRNLIIGALFMTSINSAQAADIARLNAQLAR